jgi:hypothetical protein
MAIVSLLLSIVTSSFMTPCTCALPAAQAVERLQAVLAEALDQGRFDDVAPAAGASLWTGDDRALTGQATSNGDPSPGRADALVLLPEPGRLLPPCAAMPAAVGAG